MFESLRSHWRLFRADPPGQRFVLRHARHRHRNRTRWHRASVMTLGVVAMLVGTAMLVLPGPGLLVILLGAFLVGEESLVASRLLDRIDLWFNRHLVRRREAE
jgi:putative transmembrane protein PGPGW